MRHLFLFVFALATPALAQAETIFKCKSVTFSDQLSATLRLGDDEKGGRLEVDYWNGYPPVGLVYADFKLGRTEADYKAYVTEADRTSGYVAEFRLRPSPEITGDLHLALSIAKWNARKIFALSCQRF